MNVSELIDALGGTNEVARMLGMQPSRVSNWKTFGHFPDSVRLRRALGVICDEREIALSDDLFGGPEAA